MFPIELLQRLTDAHCHPVDDSAGLDRALTAIEQLHTARLCAQSSTLENQSCTRSLAVAHPDRVIPFFAKLSPWQEHYMTLFPELGTDPSLQPVVDSLLPPTSLETYLTTLEQNLVHYPHSHVGEIGLDRAFRLPLPTHLQPPRGQGSPRSKLQTPIQHQLALVRAQLDLAIKLRRHVSFHSVRSSKETVTLLRDYLDHNPGFESIHACLHSFGGSPETIRQLQKVHHNLFFSFAAVISGRSPRFSEMLRAVDDARLLVESDFSDTSKIDEQISEVVEAICTARSWTREYCVAQLEKNWLSFLEVEPEGSRPKRKSKKERKMDEQARRRQAEEQKSKVRTPCT
ncbi:BZ3500_MvSof-1268-A1-R1_Chr6-1g08411 [Microbotryum saponariae]|uniref:BZ3500_MvSof-1268-A1-R1_Chr6-1g08411 protein n=1 Tax=Microbotryum saponariae TaxID=289078 RepID=A0A2X0KR92_9BASI|nr:BZ3500_MvSof-1268-A1-R1_Chr6-1g08411 [Microbotryum saponariae]